MAENRCCNRSGDELLEELKCEIIILEENSINYICTGPDEPSNDFKKVMRLMKAMRDCTFEQTDIYNGNNSSAVYNIKHTRVITYGGREILRIFFLKDYTWRLSISRECQRGFNLLYFEARKRHGEDVFTEFQKLSLK